MELRCVTRNLGRRTRSREWIEHLYEDEAAAPHVAFLQELPAGPLSLPDHVVALPEEPTAVGSSRCRSAILVDRRVLTPAAPAMYLREAVLGNYVARTDLKMTSGGRLTALSVHASPNPLSLDHRAMVSAEHLQRQAERHPWYADVIGDEMVQLLAATRPDHVLAAGDFNEAYGWDSRYRTDSCAEFFGKLASGGYIDATRAAWPEELSTQTAQPYQVDRIFGSEGLQVRLPADPTRSVGLDDGLSDHLPIVFTVESPTRPEA
jgi:endonuclease/exonuclease/phosphatase family metal-dependent hydrolase